jgi:hypothetical protein
MARTSDTLNEAPWLRFLGRWMLAYGLYQVATLLVFATMTGFEVFGPGAFGAAARNPASFRNAAGMDLTAWLWIGGTLLASAALFARAAPIRAAFIAACGVGQVAGLLGGYAMLVVLGSLGARSALAAPEQQAALAEASGPVLSSMVAHFGAGQLLYSAGYLLVAWVALSVAGFPRWIGAWFAVHGAYAVANQVAYVATGGIPVPMLFLVFGLVSIVVNFAIATTLWRRAPAVAPRFAASPAS